MMKQKMVLMTLAGIFALTAMAVGKPLTSHPPRDAYEGWRLSTQAYTFNRFTFFEAVDKAAELGLSWIEAYPGQKFSPEKPKAKMEHTMSAALRSEAKKKLAASGVRVVCYGVVGLPNNEAECRKVFKFCKDMGIENITSEPPEEALDLIERLCKEYKIAVAIHNHPKPSHYWNPDTVVRVCKGRSKWIGACADTGHWMRSGVNPIEALMKLRGRVIYFHLKDLNKFGTKDGAHDVPWGKGKANMPQILTLLHGMGFRGVFSAEYEHNWLNSVPELRQCVHFFEGMGRKLKPTGWKPLFADDLSNCQFKRGSWEFKDDVLTRKGGGDIWTKDAYGDFIIDLEFHVAERANSGVFIRCGNLKNWIHTTIEVQIHDTTDGTKHGQCGAIYDCLPPSKDLGSMAGRWNHMTIKAEGPSIFVVLNGEQIIDMDLNKWTEAGKNPQGTKNKFRNAYKDMPRAGLIGFQDHGNPVSFRNVKILQLGK